MIFLYFFWVEVTYRQNILEVRVLGENKLENFYGSNSKFVYYEDLQRTYPHWYDKLKQEGQSVKTGHDSRMKSIASTLLGWAAIEGQKEVNLLSQYFNTQLPYSSELMYNSEIGKQIIDTMNKCMQLKEVYERHVTRIIGPEGKNGTAKITGAQFFADYFSDELSKLVLKKYESMTDIVDMTEEEIANELMSDDIIQQAIYQTLFVRMKDSGDWSSSSDKHGYQELFTILQNFQTDQLTADIAKAYKLDELQQRLRESLSSSENLKKLVSSGKSNVKKTFKSNLKETTTAKGTLAEILGERGFAAAQQALKTAGVESKVVGAALGKADIVMTFGLDFDKILSVVDRHYENRAKTVEAYKTLNGYLNNVKSGFVVYTNAKDYSLVKNTGSGYSFSGFSAGAQISLKNLEGVIANTPGGSQTIIGQIMSTMEGAVYSDLKDELEQELCEKMAYFLFDDVLTIGKDTAASSHAIHLLLLDGVYIPLSYLFFLMSRAIDEVDRDPDDVFKITVVPGAIKWPDGPWPPGAWSAQKQIAYEQIKIGATFLKSFVDVIREVRT